MKKIKIAIFDEEFEVKNLRITMPDGAMYTIREKNGWLELSGDEPFVIEPCAANQICLRQPRPK